MTRKTVCFSGHRPKKLPFEGNENNIEVKMLMQKLYDEIDLSIKEGYTRFISGMAKGVDLWAAKYIVELKRRDYPLELVCAVPYKELAKSWKGTFKQDYDLIVDNADEIIYISEEYTFKCLLVRNKYMVDNSEKLIAMVSDYKSGTGQTIKYANKNKLEVKIINVLENVI